MNRNPINFQEKFSKFPEHWEPRVIAEMNDYQFKLVKIKGEFIWYDHKNTDETFIAISGRMEIQFRDGKVELGPGDMYVVPKGIKHKPFAQEECRVLLIEPTGVVNTGEVESDMRAENDRWICHLNGSGNRDMPAELFFNGFPTDY